MDTDRDPETINGNNIIYGGRGRDILHADSGRAGPAPGDRLMDWYGPFNLYLVCDSAYGAGRVLRQPSPQIEAALIALARADGAYDIGDETASGWRQLALVTREHAPENRNPRHPDHPGNRAFC